MHRCIRQPLLSHIQLLISTVIITKLLAAFVPSRPPSETPERLGISATAQGACWSAPQALQAKQDARALVASLGRLQGGATEEGPPPDQAQLDATTRTLRRILLQLTMVKVRAAYLPILPCVILCLGL